MMPSVTGDSALETQAYLLLWTALWRRRPCKMMENTYFGEFTIHGGAYIHLKNKIRIRYASE